MRTETPPVIRLADYRPSDYLIDRVDLDIRLHPTEARITATLALRPNPAGLADAPLVLDGDEVNLVSAALDGDPLSATEDRKSTRLNSSHANISYAVFCLKKKKRQQ